MTTAVVAVLAIAAVAAIMVLARRLDWERDMDPRADASHRWLEDGQLDEIRRLRPGDHLLKWDWAVEKEKS